MVEDNIHRAAPRAGVDSGVVLRDVVESDLPIFFEHQQDPDATRMAAFTSLDPTDRRAFDENWRRVLSDASIIKKSIVLDRQIVGHLACFERDGEREVTYWIGRDHWHRGVATQALTLFLRDYSARPLFARAAADNAASLRVLKKCGFTVVGRERAFARARGGEIEEAVLKLA